MKTYPASTIRGARFGALAFAALAIGVTAAFGQTRTSSLPARDEAAIRAASKKFMELGLAGDWTNWSALYSEDAVMMHPNRPALTGRKAIADFQAQGGGKFTKWEINPIDIQGSGNLASVRGSWSVVLQVPDYGVIVDHGKYIELWRKERDGVWRMYSDIYNSDTPVNSTLTRLPAEDEAKIRSAASNAVKAGLARDWVNFDLYADDAVMLSANAPLRQGRDAIMDWNKSAPPLKEWKHEPEEILGLGNFAVVRGRGTVVTDGGTDTAKYLEVWRKEADGAWKVIRNAWNSDLPSVVAAPPNTVASLAAEERARIVNEIKRTLDDYKAAVLRRDLSAVKSFWSDAGEFMMGGDGAIVGGAKTWYAKLEQGHQDTAKWNSWEWRNVHIEPLANNAASATLEFEHSKNTTTGTTMRVRGSWTYVFKKDGGKWRVIHSNGTHIQI